MFRLENDTKHSFRKRRDAAWAAFFDELGIRYEYAEDTEYATTFYLPEMRIHVEVLDDSETADASSIGEWLKGFVGIDEGSLDHPMDDSAVLVTSDPWVQQETKPFGTVIRDGEEPRITDQNDKATGVFMNIGSEHAYVIGRCSRSDHFGGAMISAGDALPYITDEDKKKWSEAIRKAQGREITEISDTVSVPKKGSGIASLFENPEPQKRPSPFTKEEKSTGFGIFDDEEDSSSIVSLPEGVTLEPEDEEPVVKTPSRHAANFFAERSEPRVFGRSEPSSRTACSQPVPKASEETCEKPEDTVLSIYVDMFLVPGSEFTNISKVSDLAGYCAKITGFRPDKDVLEKKLFNLGFPLRRTGGETMVGLDPSSDIYFAKLPVSYEPEMKRFCSRASAEKLKKVLCA